MTDSRCRHCGGKVTATDSKMWPMLKKLRCDDCKATDWKRKKK